MILQYKASVAGPYHIKNDIPCQDSCAVKETEDFMIGVVADGVGSQIHSEVKNARSDGLPPEVELKLSRSIADLHLSVRATNCLEAEHIMTVRELVSRSEESLLDVRNFGDTTLKEVREKLAEMGLQLGMRLPPVYANPFQ